MRRKIDCPGCTGLMGEGSITCANCRRRALAIGVQAVLDRGKEQAGPAPSEKPISTGQVAAFHAKARDLDQCHGFELGESKRAALAAAAAQLKRQIASVKHLSFGEASTVLDTMEEQLEAARIASSDLNLPELRR